MLVIASINGSIKKFNNFLFALPDSARTNSIQFFLKLPDQKPT